VVKYMANKLNVLGSDPSTRKERRGEEGSGVKGRGEAGREGREKERK
jgi:hypothetical protein